MKKESGITLMALILTIIVLIIISAIGITSGISTIRSSKYNAFITELKIMQTEINRIYQSQKEDVLGAELTEKQETILSENEVASIVYKSTNGDEERTKIKEGFRYFSVDYITNTLKIDGITIDFLVNISTRMVVSCNPFSYDGVKYYMVDQVDNGYYNVDYIDQNDKSGDFDVSTTKEENKCKIEIYNIQHKEYINKWQVKYKLKNSETWMTSNEMTFFVSVPGLYDVKVVHDDVILGENKTFVASVNTNYSNVDLTITNPDAATPEGSTVIEDNLKKGIAIKDKNENEWTWVIVPKTIYVKAEYIINNSNKPVSSDSDYEGIYNVLQAYAGKYTKPNIDSYYEGNGIEATLTKTAQQVYEDMYKKMLGNIFSNGGFWISRYEIGDETSTENNTIRITPNVIENTPVSRANQIPYTYVSLAQAEKLSEKMVPENSKTSSLLFGIQWDLVCMYLEIYGGFENSEYISKDSSSWGNYSDSEILLNRGKYIEKAHVQTSEWKDIKINTTGKVENLIKKKDTEILFTTGASEYTNVLNIYDFSGNVWEWNLEKGNNMNAVRGGYYRDKGIVSPSAYRYYKTIGSADTGIGFRATFY